MAAVTRGGREGAALSAPDSSHSSAKASWLTARLCGVPRSSAPASAASRPISSAAAGQVSPRARKGSSVSPARNCAAACPVSWMQSRWQPPSGARASGARLRIRWPADTLWGGRTRADPAGDGPAAGSEAVHFPLETRHTHSPSPASVRGLSGWTSCTEASAAVVLQSKINI